MSGFMDLLTAQANNMIDSGKYKSAPAKIVVPSTDVVAAPSDSEATPSIPPVDAGIWNNTANLPPAPGDVGWNDTTNLPPAPPPAIESQEDQNKQDNAYTQQALSNEALRSMGDTAKPGTAGATTPLFNMGHLPTQEEFARMLRMQKYREAEEKIKGALDSKFKK